MLLSDRIESQGQVLFRWRGLLPFLLLPLAALALAISAEGMRQNANAAADAAIEGVSIACSLLGLAIRAATVGFVPSGTSGRNTRSQEASVLNTSGAYSIVRNPLYVGNFCILFGFALDLQVWWFTVLVVAAFWFYYERIVFAEERFLLAQFGEAYSAWAARTPAFIPNLRLWSPPRLPFSLRTVLRREYPGLLLVAWMFSLLELSHDLVAQTGSLQHWPGDWKWWLGGTSLLSIVSLTLRWLKKRSRVLAVSGR